jgi:hypothetical protein
MATFMIIYCLLRMSSSGIWLLEPSEQKKMKRRNCDQCGPRISTHSHPQCTTGYTCRSESLLQTVTSLSHCLPTGPNYHRQFATDTANTFHSSTECGHSLQFRIVSRSITTARNEGTKLNVFISSYLRLRRRDSVITSR